MVSLAVLTHLLLLHPTSANFVPGNGTCSAKSCKSTLQFEGDVENMLQMSTKKEDKEQQSGATRKRIVIVSSSRVSQAVAQGMSTKFTSSSFDIADREELLGTARLRASQADAARTKALRDGDAWTATVSARAAHAAKLAVQQFSPGSMQKLLLYNPSLIEMPKEWRQTGEKWLAVMRTQTAEPTGANEYPTWFDSYIVLAVLDDGMQTVRPLRFLGSEHLFQDLFDCQMLTKGNHSYFGPEDARLFAPATGSDSSALLFFTGRAHSQELSRPCRAAGGQRMFVAKLGADLRPLSSNVILVRGEGGTESIRGEPEPPRKSTNRSFPMAGHLGQVEKNWSPFIGNGEQHFLEYSIEPHVVMSLDISSHFAGEELYETSSPLVKEWQESKGWGEVFVHGGVAPILIGLHGQRTYLSVLHTQDPANSTYRSFLFTFAAEPPFGITAVSQKELPLHRQICSWGADVAFPTGMNMVGNELWLMYGSGDLDSRRLVLSKEELNSFLPFAKTPGKDVPFLIESKPSEAQISRLVNEDLSVKKRALEWEAQKPQDAEMALRLRDAVDEDMRSKAFSQQLYNPTMVELPAPWRRPGEKWLAAFRQKDESQNSVPWEGGSDAAWYFFSLVLTVLDADLKPMRPLKVLRSVDFFQDADVDCQLKSTNVSYFGPADARLFLGPSESAPDVMLVFTARATGKSFNSPCSAHGGQRMFVAKINEDLQPESAGPILVTGDLQDRETSGPFPAQQEKAINDASGMKFNISSLKEVEKNWAPFLYQQSSGFGSNVSLVAQPGPEMLLEYSIEPHVIVDYDPNTKHAAGRRVWTTASSVLKAWLVRQQLQSKSKLSGRIIHGGVGALRVEMGDNPVFLSVLHYTTEVEGAAVYKSFLYTFSVDPPFRILGVAGRELPLVKKPCRWGARVAFPTSILITPESKDFWVLYGSGDSESRRWSSTWAELQQFLPQSSYTSEFLYRPWRIGKEAYQVEGETFEVQSIEPHIVKKKGGKLLESWSTSSSILQAFAGKKLSFAPLDFAAHYAQLAENTPRVYVSFFEVLELGQYHIYMFEAQPPFRILGMGQKPIPEASLTSVQKSLAEDKLTEIRDFLPSAPVWPKGMTVVTMAHGRDRLDGLISTLNMYRMSDHLLHEIVLIWNNQTDLEPIRILREKISESEGIPVRVLQADANSMNNRFAVWPALQTEGVIIQDDDLWISPSSLELLVKAWQSQPERLLGSVNERVDVQPQDVASGSSYRLKEVNPKCYDVEGSDISSCDFPTPNYAILLPHPWALSQSYLQEYMKHPKATRLVDDMKNCDDIYLNAVVANATKASPIALQIPVHRNPEWANGNALWVSAGKKWLEDRSRCLEEVNSMYESTSPLSKFTGTVWRHSSANEVYDRKTTTSIVGSVLLIIVMLYLGRWLLRGQSQGENDSQSNGQRTGARVDVYDNAKFLLSVFIVHCHFVMYSTHWNLWDARVMAPLESKMPLIGFSLLSGIVSGGKPSAKKWLSLFQSLLLAQLLYAVVLDAPLTDIGNLLMGNPVEFGLENYKHRLIDPAGRVDWYLQSLAVWRGLTFAAHHVADRTETPMWPWVLSIFALVMAFLSYVSVPFFSLNNLPFFMPSFLVGLLFPVRELIELVPPTWGVRLSGGAALVAWLTVPGLPEFLESFPCKQVWQTYAAFPEDPAREWEVWFLWSRSLFASLVESVLFLVILVTLCPRGETRFTANGRDGALYAYLLHPLLGLPFMFLIFQRLPLTKGGSVLEFLVMLLEIFTSAIVAWLLSSPPVISLFSPLLSPTWSNKVLGQLLGRSLIGDELKNRG
mmetsp:Transcript_82514/g.145636  ORF Transcript_82514/g.145636 Transcript_82514/m.145636 type:complete len:1803 (+) Transcript_82514:2-5410(+)